MGTLSRIILDRHGDPQKIIHPTSDDELSDPAFSPANSYLIDVTTFEQATIRDGRDALVVIQQKLVTGGHLVLASVVQARIDRIDAIAQAQIDRDAWLDLVERWPTPTPLQRTQITAARLKALASAQAVQDKRDTIAALVAQLP